MPDIIDKMSVVKESTGEVLNDSFIRGMDADRWYPGVDLTTKFADEISNYSDAWAWVRTRIKAGNFYGIHVNDYIPFTCTNGTKLKACVGGINTYKDYGDRQQGNHIDFISRSLWPTGHQMNPVNWNNGLIPIENLSGDGTSTVFVLTKEMKAIDNIKISGIDATNFTYDNDTYTISFAEAPVAGSGNIVVTGVGTPYPWLASDLYHWMNSLEGQVVNSADNQPAVTHVNYTQSGIYYYLPQELKNVIVEKRILLPQRNGTSKLSSDNSWGWTDMGKLWIPSELEITGCPIFGNSGLGAGGFVQYPIFNCCMNRAKGYTEGGRNYWWTLSAYSGNTTPFVYVYYSGNVGNSNASNTYGAPVCFRVS